MSKYNLNRKNHAYSMKGGGSTTSTNYTSTLPEYAEPYYKELMARSEAETYLPYQNYDQARISGFSPGQTEAMQGTENLYYTGNPAIDAGVYATGQGVDAAGNLVSNGGQLSSTYQGAQGYDPMSVDAGGWNSDVMQQYMSPYMDAVVQRQQEDAILQAQRQQKFRDAEAVQAGAFGGDRRFINDYLSDEGLLRQLGDINAYGLQSAYENAQQQYERDRAAQFEAAGMGEQSRQYGTGLTEQGRQFGAGLEAQLGQFNEQNMLDRLNTLYQGGAQLGQLGDMSQAAELERINSLYGMGQQEQQQWQQALDQAYEDFLNQRDYNRNSLTWLSGIMHGVPVSAQSNVVQYAPEPNQISQALGSGIAGLSLYNAYQE